MKENIENSIASKNSIIKKEWISKTIHQTLTENNKQEEQNISTETTLYEIREKIKSLKDAVTSLKNETTSLKNKTTSVNKRLGLMELKTGLFINLSRINKTTHPPIKRYKWEYVSQWWTRNRQKKFVNNPYR